MNAGVLANLIALLRPPLRVAAVAAALTATSAAMAQPSILRNLLFDPQPLLSDPASGPAPVLAATSAASGAETSAAGDGALAGTATARSAAPVDISEYLDSIAAIELEGGAYAPELMEQHLALGELYQQQGDHEEALAAFDKADYISRINSGLYTPQQFTIVENMIASHLARGEVLEAQRKQDYLFFLNRQYYGDTSLQVVPALESLADWNLDAFRAMLNQRNASNLVMERRAPMGVNAINPRELAFGNLYQARMNYHQAIRNMLQHQQFRDPKLIELEYKMVEAEFLAASRNGILDNPDFYMDERRMRTGSRIARNSRNAATLYFINGRNAYRRMRLYQENLGEVDHVEIARSIIGLGDWNLLFHRQMTALNHYKEARDYLTANGVPAGTIDSLLAPAVPEQLPVFTPLPHSREKFALAPDAEIPYEGHIDLRFEISRFGNVGGIKVLDRQGAVTPDIERRLKRVLQASPFRPRFVDGELARSDEVTVRYYFTQIN